MDSLSQLIELCHGEMILDALCILDGEFDIPHDSLPKGEAMFHLVLTGSCIVTPENNQSYRIEQGDFFILTQGQSHRVSYKKNITKPQATFWQKTNQQLPIYTTSNAKIGTGLDLLCGRIRYPQHLGKALLQSLPPILNAHLYHKPGMPTLSLLTNILRQESASEELGSWSIINALAQTLLVYALRCYGQQNHLQASWIHLLSDERLSKSIQAMLQFPAYNWSLSRLAETANMSRATYARHFKNLSNETPLAVLQSIRIMHASQLLMHSKKSISTIAEASGYRSEAAFTKVFKQLQGNPPSIWRKQNSNNSL